VSVRALGILVVALSLGCGGGSSETEPLAAERVSTDVLRLAPELVERAELEIIDVGKRALEQTLEITGRIELNEDRTARVGSPAEGRISRVDVSLGDVVAEGAPLVQIHSHELIVARSDYSKATTTLSASERRLRIARTEYDRAERLLTAKALSDRERLAAEAELAGAEAEWERARAELARAEHYLLHLGVDADAEGADGDLTIRAPLTGVVLERSVTLGAVVSPTDDLILLSDLRTLWVVGEVPEREAALVSVGQTAAIEVAAFPSERFEAKVFHIGEQLDPELRTVSVRLLLDNPDRRLRPEMYATIRIAREKSEPVLVVPERALQLFDEEQVVFVALDQGRFERRRVTTRRAIAGLSEVTAGLVEGERVVAEGSFLIKSEFLRSHLEEE
jgi:cobalt-zinc-cadmium efflux system membrane fusion protein